MIDVYPIRFKPALISSSSCHLALGPLRNGVATRFVLKSGDIVREGACNLTHGTKDVGLVLLIVNFVLKSIQAPLAHVLLLLLHDLL